MPFPFHQPPTKPYCGLTLVLSHPSRFDRASGKLLSGLAGDYFLRDCLSISPETCDIRIASNKSPLLPNTKSVLLLGQHALTQWTDETATIHKLHGAPVSLRHSMGYNGHAIPGFFPQDSFDQKDWESAKNPFCPTYTGHFADEGPENTEDDGGGVQKGRHTVVSRKNYKFWIQADTRKAKMLALTYNGILPEQSCELIYPANPNDALQVLNKASEEHIYLDIETDTEQNLNCIGFAVGDSPVYVLPIIDWNYGRFYGDQITPKIFRALVRAMARNTVVCHNSFFDILVLLWKYKLPIGRKHWDTMIAMRRHFPECEIALSHAISYYTWLAYHKDAGIFMPSNRQQSVQLWHYNALDVKATREVHRAQLAASEFNPELRASMEQGSSMLYTYLLMSVTGMRYDQKKLRQMQADNARLMTQLLRILRLLLGYEFLPTSSKQSGEYFHLSMGYPEVKFTDNGNAKWDEDVLRKLKIKHPTNLTIDLCLKYRGLKKETGSLKFIPWRELP